MFKYPVAPKNGTLGNIPATPGLKNQGKSVFSLFLSRGYILKCLAEFLGSFLAEFLGFEDIFFLGIFRLKHNPSLIWRILNWEIHTKTKTQSISWAPFQKIPFWNDGVFFFCHFLMRSLGISKDCWHVLLRDAAWHGAALIEGMASKFLPPKIFGILTGMGVNKLWFWDKQWDF